MGILLKRFPEYRVTLEIYRGVITPELLFGRLGRLRQGDMARWVGYFDATADLSRVDIAALPEIKRASAARMRELHAENGLIAFVCSAPATEHLIEFWCRFLRVGGEHPTSPALFPNLKTAFDWMDLPEAARQALTAAVGAEISAEPEAEAEGGPQFQQL